MILHKSIAIGVIALFIGLTCIPLSEATVNETEQMIPIELSVMNTDGTLGCKKCKLPAAVITALIILFKDLVTINDRHTIQGRIDQFFNNFPSASGLREWMNINLIEKLPGSPIISYGKGRSLAARYHGRVMAKKLLTVWEYPNSVGATVIWGNGIALPPTQILLMHQIGFMVGFVGLYVYIPPLLEGTSTTFFMGSSLFAYGISV